MLKLANSIDVFNRRVGRVVGWLVLAMVLLQFSIVLMRHVFGIGSIEAQEAVTFMHGMVFMLAAAWVLQSDRHVRVDIFYAHRSTPAKAVVNLAGSLLLLMPMILVIGYYAFPYVAESWRIGEGSPDTDGLPMVYIQKTAILAFAAMLALQGLVQIMQSLHTLRQGRV